MSGWKKNNNKNFLLVQQALLSSVYSIMLVGVSSEGSEKLVRQVSQMEEGTLGLSLEARQLLDRRGQNIDVTLVVAT